MEILEPEEAIEKFNEYMESREWWVLGCDNANKYVIAEIEEKFYTPGTEANGDFHMMLHPVYGVCFFARKTRLSADEFNAFLQEHGGSSELRAGGNKDVIFLGS
jgi:hypothetical protein